MLQVELGNRRLRASLWMTALALAGVLLFVQLGRWQWHRAAQKRALAASFAAGARQPAGELGARSLVELPRYSPLRLRGHYDGLHQFLLDNMSHGGPVGYEVLTPFQLEDGRWLVVNRGWLPLPQGRRDLFPDIALSGFGTLEIRGRIDALPAMALRTGRAAPAAGPLWPKRTSFPTTAQLAASLGHPLEAGQLLLGDSEPQGYRRDWQAAGDGFGPERHIAYALQWWAFAALAAFLYGFMNIERRTP